MVLATLPDSALYPHLGDPRVLVEILSRRGVLERGHFQLLSGAHSEHFLRFSAVASDVEALDHVAAALQPTVAAWQPAGVLAPSTAGVSLGRELASRLSVPLYLADVDGTGRAQAVVGGLGFERDALLLVNDVVTTGDGFWALAQVAQSAGATIAGAAWFASRAEVDLSSRLGARTACVVSLNLPCFAAGECPCCAAGQPAVDALDLN